MRNQNQKPRLGAFFLSLMVMFSPMVLAEQTPEAELAPEPSLAPESVPAKTSLKSLSLKNKTLLNATTITGGQPNKADITELSAIGVTTVINLRGIGEFTQYDEPTVVKNNQLNYAAIPIASADDLTLENATKLADILQKADGKVLIHCASGNRVGALLAIKAYSIDKLSLKESLALGKAAGMTRLTEKVETLLTKLDQ